MAEPLNFRDLNVVLRENTHSSSQTNENNDDIDVHPVRDIDLSTARPTVRNVRNTAMADSTVQGSNIVLIVRAEGSSSPTIVEIRCSRNLDLQVLHIVNNSRGSASRPSL